MSRTYQFATTCLAIAALGSTASAATLQTIEEYVDLHPFTHVAYIPASADLSSIRIQKIKAVKVATKRRLSGNTRYCEERSAAEPGGSMYCPYVADESPVWAYQITYSFKARPMASDESQSADFTFSVYFRPDELSPEARIALRTNRTAAAEFLQVTTSRGAVRQIVVDSANSTFCEGNYVDGNWMHADPKCKDSVAYKNVVTASAYITVRVDPASSRLATVAMSSIQ